MTESLYPRHADLETLRADNARLRLELEIARDAAGRAVDAIRCDGSAPVPPEFEHFMAGRISPPEASKSSPTEESVRGLIAAYGLRVDRIKKAEARAEAAEARVKELEADHNAEFTRAEANFSEVTKLRAKLAQCREAVKLVQASCRSCATGLRVIDAALADDMPTPTEPPLKSMTLKEWAFGKPPPVAVEETPEPRQEPYRGATPCPPGEFTECALCAAKSGAPDLCPSCLQNRLTISTLQRRVQEARDAALRDAIAVIWAWDRGVDIGDPRAEEWSKDGDRSADTDDLVERIAKLKSGGA